MDWIGLLKNNYISILVFLGLCFLFCNLGTILCIVIIGIIIYEGGTLLLSDSK